ncbi:MAG: glycosyltransferase family 2 protein [Candidatus Omnitrophota bacterium]|jgi:glycosyltransferase involved in cell wall biosynthesis
MNDVCLYIPCYNSEKTIRLSLEAVLKQSYPLKEVLVIDDCSSDKSVEIVSSYPVKLLRLDTNSGLASVRNIAIHTLKSEYVASVDADCVPEKDWLKYSMRRFDRKGIAGVGGKLVERNQSSLADIWRSVHMKQHWDGAGNNPEFLFGSNTVFKKETLVNIGGYNEILRNNYEDVDICNRLEKAGYSYVYEPEAIAYHYKQDDACSVLNNFWRWYFPYNQSQGFYSGEEKLLLKVKDNLGLANRFIGEDAAAGRQELLYLDFLLAFHHSLKDLEYMFICQSSSYPDSLPSTYWLSLVDLTFACHVNLPGKDLLTFLPESNAFVQNCLALNLILGGLLKKEFKSDNFNRLLFKHLLFSLDTFDDDAFLDAMANLVNYHTDWRLLFQAKHPYLNSLFLEHFINVFNNWIWNLKPCIKGIESSAQKF